jgi:hypothetical protein
MSNMPPSRTQYFPLAGGIDAETAARTLKPGFVLGALNYESSALEGYQRIGGFERFDGQTRPSDAGYLALEADGLFSGVIAGDVVVGVTSAATGKVLLVRSGGQIIVGRVSGAFEFGETINVSGSPIGALLQYASDITGFDDNEFLKLAEDDRRADIAAVPGSGPIRGIAVLGSTVYAWRDNAGATACDIYKSSASGWLLVALYKSVGFSSGGGVEPIEGATVTKGAASATIKRVVLESGTWGAGTAQGRFIVDAVTGGPFSAGAFTAGVAATCDGAESAISLLPGGRLDHVVYNFTGFAGRQRIYGADGVNKGFEFDGNVYVPISTGMAADAPVHCSAHKNHLFFSFSGSVQHSGIGSPYQWSVISGAGELAAGDVITGFHVLAGDSSGGALMVLTLTRTWVLYGTSAADWQFTVFSNDVGAQRWSIQSLGRVLVFDTIGVATVQQSQSFGNFDRLPLSARIQRLIANRTVLSTVVNRALKRMRIFFSEGDSLSITPIDDLVAFMPFDYGMTVYATTDAIINSEQRNFFGGVDGFVYEADRGRGFDGEQIFAHLKLAFNHAKSPMDRKRFRRVEVETTTDSACQLSTFAEYSLGAPDVSLTSTQTIIREGLGAYFDLTNFEQSYYDTPRYGVNRVRLDGVGTDISLSFISRANNELPHVLHSVSTVFTPRRMER